MGFADEKGVLSPSFRALGGRQAGCYSNMLEELIKYCPSTKMNEGEAKESSNSKSNGQPVAKAQKIEMNQGGEVRRKCAKERKSYVKYLCCRKM